MTKIKINTTKSSFKVSNVEGENGHIHREKCSGVKREVQNPGGTRRQKLYWFGMKINLFIEVES